MEVTSGGGATTTNGAAQKGDIQASVVVIGAGIVGNSVAYHLAERGWSSIVIVDKGPLPDPGGSTGHASNFIFPVDHSKAITQITLDSMHQYEDMGVLTACGGIEIARTEERLEELRRRMSSAIAWGIESELIDADRACELVPFLNRDLVKGAFWTPSASVVDPLRAGTIMREKAAELAELTVMANTTVTGLETADDAITAVHTDRGTIATDNIVVACGVWSPRITRMAGVSIPLTPAVHQMIDVGPIDELADTGTEIAYPIVRDMDTLMYERQSGPDLEIGSYAHRPILHWPDDIPSIEAAQLSPTQLPFTDDDFDPQMQDALDLFGSILDREEVGVRHAINGLLSITPDGGALLGPAPEVRGMWLSAAVWIKEGPGVGRALADWMTHGTTEYDLHSLDITRFYNSQRSEAHARARAMEGFNKTYGIVHPREQWLTSRPQRVSPFHERTQALGAEYFEVGGWERPQWYESNAGLVDEFGVANRPHEWDRRWWSPIIDAEHLAMRERCAMIDLSAFAQFDVVGPGAMEFMQGMLMRQADTPVGRLIYTPVLTPDGGFRSDLTVARLGVDHYRIITGGADGPRDALWFRRHLPADGSASIVDVTSALCTIGLWGPRARDVLASLTSHDLSHEAFKFGSAQQFLVGTVPVTALRVSYVGDLGWELHAPFEQGRQLWDMIAEAGKPYGIVPAGIGVYGGTGRLEKGYRLMGAELDSEHSPVEAGLATPRVKAADFIGKEAYLRARENPASASMCTLQIEDHRDGSGMLRYPQGGEPILSIDGKRIVDALGRPSYVTTTGSAPSVDAQLALAYLPPEHAQIGHELLLQYMGHRYPATVASVDRTSVFDPDNTRMLR